MNVFFYSSHRPSTSKLIFLPACIILLSSCKSCKNDPVKEIKIAAIPYEVKINRLDRDLFEKNPDSLLYEISGLRKKYGSFFDAYCRDIINMRAVNDTALALGLKNFVTNDDIREIYSETQKQYPELKFLEKELTAAFKRYKFHFPDSQPPAVVANFSGFNYAVYTHDTVLAIGLDFFLGENCIFYEMLAWPKYVVRNMNRQSIAATAIKGWALNLFENKAENKTLLDNMIFNGKILYLMDMLLPDMHDSLLTAYKNEQLEWCRKNEANIWTHFVESKLLYSTDHRAINKYMGEGPFTTGLPRESPARIGEFTGWMIVKKYMSEHPETTLPQLFAEKDSQKILAGSKYKPKK